MKHSPAGYILGAAIGLFLCLPLFLIAQCRDTQKGVMLQGTYNVLSRDEYTSKARTITFSPEGALFTYTDGTSETYAWRIEDDYRYTGSNYKILTINDLMYEIVPVTKNTYRICPLFGEESYSNLFLVKKYD